MTDCKFQNYLGSRPLLVTSGEAWYLSYFYTEETRTARPRAPPTRARLHLSCLPCRHHTATAATTPLLSLAIVTYRAHRLGLAQRLRRHCLGVGVRSLLRGWDTRSPVSRGQQEAAAQEIEARPAKVE